MEKLSDGELQWQESIRADRPIDHVLRHLDKAIEKDAWCELKPADCRLLRTLVNDLTVASKSYLRNEVTMKNEISALTEQLKKLTTTVVQCVQ